MIKIKVEDNSAQCVRELKIFSFVEIAEDDTEEECLKKGIQAKKEVVEALANELYKYCRVDFNIEKKGIAVKVKAVVMDCSET